MINAEKPAEFVTNRTRFMHRHFEMPMHQERRHNIT
ncbi:hypothetical protein ALQ74_200132 [Pseudomonas savastanoi pv. glycinea]|uniref:Uncharacterized protein n=1 Tax=Pseudomonas savastanoi pv. glycinea TaxID=318 RepID=A0A3M3FI80_PSESG|nr:hypothetical protein ALQ74_200132 [Pseudomonas savastanoi pv. glycinea]